MDRNELYSFIDQDNSSERYDDLLELADGGPVGEDMQSEVEPSMQYFAEGGEVERGLFSQQLPQRQPMQQRLKRTAAEMLQRMPQAQLGTMRFAPLNMPGIAGRPIQQFAEGGAVAEQLDKGAPVDNLFGADLTTPGPAPLPSFETNIPEFTPEYTPPTGPVNLTGSTDTTLKTFPTGLGDKAPTFTFAGTQQATVPTTAKSLYEQISPSSLAAGPYDFRMATGTLPDTSTGAKPGATLGTAIYTPTEQTFTKPTLLSEEEARLKQPVLTRYEPDIKFGGLTTYLGPLQTSPYKDTDTGGGTTGGGTTGGATTAGDWKTYGFTAPKEGSTYSEKPTYWFNRQLGLFVETPTGGFTPPPASEGLGKWEMGGFYTPSEDTLTGGEGEDTVTGGGGVEEVNWRDETAFPTGPFTLQDQFKRRQEGLSPTTLEDVFKAYGGVDLDAKTANLYKNAKFGWNKATDSFAITPASTAAILSSKTFKDRAGKTVDSMLSELGYTVGGKKTTGTNISAADRNNYVAQLASGNMDITRLANTLTEPLRSAGVFSLSPTMQTFNRVYAATAPAATGGAGTGGAGTGGAGTGTKPMVQTSKGLVSASLARAFGPQLEAAVRSGAIKTKAMGSGPEGEYADPVAAIRERQRMRRESGTMDQGSARAQLKKFLGGEDLTPVQEFAEGGEVGSISGLKAKQLAQKRGLRPEDFGVPAGSWTNQALADALGMTITKGAGGRALAIPTSMQPAKTAEDVLAQYNKLGATDFDMLDKPMSYLTEKGKAEYRTNQPLRVSQLEQMGAGLNLTPEQINQAYSTGYGTAADRYNEYLRWKNKGSGGIQGFLEKATIPITKAAFAYFGGNALANALGGAGSLAPGSVPTATAPVMVPGTEIPLSTAANVGKTAYNVSRSKDPEQALTNAAFRYGAGPLTLPSRVTDLEIIQNAGKRIGLNLGQPQFGPNVKTPDIMPQYFGKGGAVKKAADLLKSLGVTEGKVAGKELTTLQDAHTSLGDAVRERAAKMQQQMDAMQFKYGPGQYVFTESSARKNLPPLEIKAKRLYGDQPMREPHPDNSLLGKVIKDPETGRAKRTPYEPGYLVRQKMPEGDWAEYIIPESAIKGAVDGFRHGGVVHRAEGSPVYGEMADTGGITPDTMAALLNRRGVNASEVLRTLKDIYGQGVSNLESGLRGSVAAIPGSIGDIESIFRDSDKTRKFATTEEVLRDYMPKRVTKPTKEAAGFEEVGTYLPLPVPAGTATKVVKGAKKGAKKTLEELGPTVASMAERQLQRSGLGPMYAVKPKGGTFFPPEYGSRMDDYLDEVVKGLTSSQTLAGKDAKTVADFIRTKGRKYLTTAYGTSDDPLRGALLEGRLPRYGSDKERFRSYLMKAAESGDPEALQDLERAYDQATGVRAVSYVPPDMEGTAYAVSGKADRAMRERMAAEGVEPEFMNPDYPSPATKEQLEASYSTESRKNLGKLMRMLENAPTTEEKQAMLNALGGELKTLSYAAEKGEPIYDVMGPTTDFMNARNVAQGIASIPVGELGRMSFPEAVIKGAQNMRFKRDWEAVIDNAKAGKPVPKEIYFQGTQPVYELGKNQQWVRIMTPDAVELEGAAMRHSIGGYKTSTSYNLGGRPAFESGKARVFSLRNEKGVPQVTVETEFTEPGAISEGGLRVMQIRSKFNSMPTPEEKKAVFELFDTLGPQSFKSTSYSTTRTGDRLDEAKEIDWGNEYQDYLKYKNKGEE